MDTPEDPFDALSGGSDDVKIIAPDYALKKIIGEDVDIRAVFSPERVEKAQEAINQHKQDFVGWVQNDVAELEKALADARAHLPHAEADLTRLARTAFVIKSQAGTFGFTLATHVAKSLDDFCNAHPAPTEAHLLVVQKHVDALKAIFAGNITGDGGKIGEELAGGLYKLVQKFKA